MKPIIALYCEGSETKMVVVIKDKEKIRVVRAASFDILQPTIDYEASVSGIQLDDDSLDLKSISDGLSNGKSESLSLATISVMKETLKDISLKNSLFLPTLTEPSIFYHVVDAGKLSKSSKLTQEILNDIQDSKNIVVDQENLGYVELADKSLLSVFLSGEIGCVKLINALAQSNGRRYYKIPSIKSADISLAYYVIKKKKFFPDDQSLIVYIGKEYSKLIFVQGRKLKHIGSTLDIGTSNIHTYDVYFSKILLEMENGGISSLDNIVVCGEDDSENLILSFYGTFPEANVSRLEFKDINISALDKKTREKFSSYSIPLAAAFDYIEELEEKHVGLNLLPKYVKEEQKPFQFAWHGYAMLPLLFIAAFLITFKVLSNNKEIAKLNSEISKQSAVVMRNQQTLNKISELESKISNFDRTQAILDSAAVGTKLWSKVVRKISDFFGTKRSLWLTSLTMSENNKIVLEGYALNKFVLTEFAYYLKAAEIKGVFYEALREKDSYKFNISFDLLTVSQAN